MKNFKNEYFDDGFICPYCGEVGIESINEPVNHGNSITQDVVCSACDKEWKEIYNLVRTKSIEENKILMTIEGEK